jgi:flagellar P-ring protein precursor FlgI
MLFSFIRDKLFIRLLLLMVSLSMAFQVSASVRIKEISRIAGAHDNSLVGYGLVVGLAGTGDSSRSRATTQSVLNALSNFGVNVSESDISSRNVAAVMVTAEMPAFSDVGTKIDVNASSLGDARSLVGGTLLLAPLRGADNQVYALAQGPISVGGYKYDFNGNLIQKNHPTVGIISMGATIERYVSSSVIKEDGTLSVVLNSADYTTANRVEDAINKVLGGDFASAVHAGRVDVLVPENMKSGVKLMSMLENIEVKPDVVARVVVNERTGTVVAGGNVRIDDVTISHANIKVAISTEFTASQPQFVKLFGQGGSDISTVVVPNTDIEVNEDKGGAVSLPSGATISDMVTALQKIHASTRDIITILQAIKRAGALHAELVIQ